MNMVKVNGGNGITAIIPSSEASSVIKSAAVSFTASLIAFPVVKGLSEDGIDFGKPLTIRVSYRLASTVSAVIVLNDLPPKSEVSAVQFLAPVGEEEEDAEMEEIELGAEAEVSVEEDLTNAVKAFNRAFKEDKENKELRKLLVFLVKITGEKLPTAIAQGIMNQYIEADYSEVTEEELEEASSNLQYILDGFLEYYDADSVAAKAIQKVLDSITPEEEETANEEESEEEESEEFADSLNNLVVIRRIEGEPFAQGEIELPLENFMFDLMDNYSHTSEFKFSKEFAELKKLASAVTKMQYNVRGTLEAANVAQNAAMGAEAENPAARANEASNTVNRIISERTRELMALVERLKAAASRIPAISITVNASNIQEWAETGSVPEDELAVRAVGSLIAYAVDGKNNTDMLSVLNSDTGQVSVFADTVISSLSAVEAKEVKLAMQEIVTELN